jgi:APA family basic amino acid/polyamine antiporter
VLLPAISEERYVIPPLHVARGYAFSLSTAQLIAILVIALLTFSNCRGIRYGKIIQNLFTSAKILALAALIIVGLTVGADSTAIHSNLSQLWTPQGFTPVRAGLTAASAFGLVIAICVSQSGSMFSADAWHDITFAAGEVKRPGWTIPRALVIGTAVTILLYLLANLAYLAVLPLASIQHAPSDRVATAMLDHVFPGWGSALMAIAIMISTFGCLNSLILAGARAYYAMARDRMFLQKAGEVNRARVPGWSLAVQGVWSAALVLPRTFDINTHTYGNLYSNLLDYVISAALVFYILAIAGVIRMRRTRPGAERPYRAFGYPIIPAIYIAGAGIVLLCLFVFRPATTWPGLLIVVCGLPVYWLRRRS